ncbi:MAG: DUF4112 domain-containing protein [Chthoniobacterales bacterium]|nr:DUF4112 domain-containing protein [Chthoniobacterales bacterium]
MPLQQTPRGSFESAHDRRRPPLQEAEWEVLPPEEKQKRAQLEPLFKFLALFMDDLVRIPGTRFRFGLDPLLGLLPGLGDTSSAFVSAYALIQAARRGLPKILLARMSANILINELVGIIPVVGDAFSFWFKSNARNYQLLQDYTASSRPARASDWFFVVGVLVLLVLIVAAGLFVSMFVLRQIWILLTGH